MEKILIFLGKWIGSYCLIISAMAIDNIFWISSSPEYPQFKKMSLQDKIKYILKNRVKEVLINWRDITPAIITSFVLAWFI